MLAQMKTLPCNLLGQVSALSHHCILSNSFVLLFSNLSIKFGYQSAKLHIHWGLNKLCFKYIRLASFQHSDYSNKIVMNTSVFICHVSLTPSILLPQLFIVFTKSSNEKSVPCSHQFWRTEITIFFHNHKRSALRKIKG